MNFLDQIASDMCRAAKDDYVGLWQIIGAVVRESKSTDKDKIRTLSLDVVRKLLILGLRPVDLPSVGSGSVPWAIQQPDAVIDRIETEWKALGREPDIGEIAWFDLPAK